MRDEMKVFQMLVTADCDRTSIERRKFLKIFQKIINLLKPK